MLSLRKRFEAKVSPEPNTGCHIFTGAMTSPSGHGRLRDGQMRLALAHRVAWEMNNGRPVPDGLWVLHKCDNGWCVNPAHLYAGTHIENINDKVTRGRCESPVGSAHGKARLAEDEVRAIRLARASGARVVDLANAYAMAPCTITQICNRTTWRHDV